MTSSPSARAPSARNRGPRHQAATSAGGVLIRAQSAAEVGAGEVQRSEAHITWNDDFSAWVEMRRQIPAGESSQHVDLRYSRQAAQLDNYGSWVYVDDINSWAWQPAVGGSWEPYRAGRWYWTSTGWAWISYEPWGWLPHHYGSWHFSVGFGWTWSWGGYWGPAWVHWGGPVQEHHEQWVRGCGLPREPQLACGPVRKSLLLCGRDPRRG